MKQSLKLSVLLALFTIQACVSPVNLTEQGRYDEAIDLCVRRLSGKKKKKAKFVDTLEAAFQKATSDDMRAVENLTKEDRPENWEIILRIHQGIRQRQRKIEPLIPLIDENGRTAQFRFVRVDDLEREAKEKTAEYYYSEGMRLLNRAQQTGVKQDARAAYTYFERLLNLFRSYKDTDDQLNRALALGTVHTLIRMSNESNVILPREFEDELLRMTTGDLNSRWKMFHTENQRDVNMDYTVLFRITNIAVSPERVREREYTDTREIEDGFEYVLDRNGNVLKDSLGNDVTVPRRVVVQAYILEVYQSKFATVSGKVDYIDNWTRNLVDSDQLSVNSVFDNYASTFRGDRRALSKESLQRIGNQPMPFPPDEALLLQAANLLKPLLKQQIARNVNLR
jgi:hypothetical protein